MVKIYGGCSCTALLISNLYLANPEREWHLKSLRLTITFLDRYKTTVNSIEEMLLKNPTVQSLLQSRIREGKAQPLGQIIRQVDRSNAQQVQLPDDCGQIILIRRRQHNPILTQQNHLMVKAEERSTNRTSSNRTIAWNPRHR